MNNRYTHKAQLIYTSEQSFGWCEPCGKTNSDIGAKRLGTNL